MEVNSRDVSADFDEFVRSVEPRLRPALVARLGPTDGREATAEALAWAWQRWPQPSGLTNPVGYLYRVGMSRTRRIRRPSPVWGSPNTSDDTEHLARDGAIREALSRLTPPQRVAVVLVDGFGWTLAEVAELRRTGRSTVQKHLERGRTRLRSELQGSDDDD